ncbi:MAG: ABC transporter ATP-binding protein [Clostridiales bacterium]|nr:ABC transporter ATP-binding protein [Clostridiales bacterium]
MSETKEQILKIRDLDITFRTTAGSVHAIRGVNIDLKKGETVAIVGESGSGKSVTMKAAMGILASNAKVTGGSIEFSYHHADGTPETVDILTKDKKWIRRHINGKRIAMVFQDPMTSLDPTMTIGKQIMEGMIWHFKTPKKEAWEKAVSLLKEVGIEDAEKRMKNYPHQLSGGMRQRVVIAIALACNPDLLICDEPTTALDVTIQKQILLLLKEMCREMNLSVIFITHDLGVVAELCDRVVVLYGGLVMEEGGVIEVFEEPAHPYTLGLLASVPKLTQEKAKRLTPIPGSPPDLLSPPAGCPFAARCRYARKICLKAMPEAQRLSPTHYGKCFLLDPGAPKDANPFADRRAR